jgi:predicted pyridoxine 5'-phosphate oxidase superfamily flavin-nucleotide-binding protein
MTTTRVRDGFPEGSPFHHGELEVQDNVGVKDKVARFGQRMIQPFMDDDHREFFEELPFVFVGSLDASGQPWASIIWGLPGFATAPDPTTLVLAGNVAAGDPLLGNHTVGSPIGVLGLELDTRRRNRANGVVVASATDGKAFTLRVHQSFGNCQKYIQVRHAKFRRRPSVAVAMPVTVEGASLSLEARRIVSASDTFFIASASAAPSTMMDGAQGEGVDVSHRGGIPGFAGLGEDDGHTVISFPDYLGNFLFNTLGNIQANPRVGLLFVDFEQGSLLTLAGQARIVWDGPEVRAVPGAQRLVRVTIERGVHIANALPFAWTEPEFAPQFVRRQRA